MGVMTDHIQADKRTGRLSYRRVFPAELRPFIPKSPRELKRSLRAKSLKDRTAQRRLAEAEAEYDRLVVQAGLKASGTTQELLEGSISFLVQTYAHRLRKNLSATHFDLNDDRRDWLSASAWRYAPFALMDELTAQIVGKPSPWTNAERLRAELPELLRTWRMLRADGNREGVIQTEGQTAEDLLNEHHLTTDTGGETFFRLCLSLLSMDIAAGEQLLRLVTEGDEIEAVPPPVMPVSEPLVAKSPVAAAGQQTETMGQLGAALIASVRNPVGRSTAESWNTALRFWRETHGDIGWHAITRRDVAEWLDLLAQRPARPQRAHSSLPLKELVALYADKEGVARITGKTMRQHVGSLSAIWGKASANGGIERDDNPFKAHAVDVVQKDGGNPLTRDELKAVFSLPIYSQGQRPTRGKGEAAYWIPLLSLCTGARPGEVAQLMVSDFWKSDDDRWMMRYTDEGVHPAAGQRRLKTSKKNSGRREFPVPKALLDLGLVAYLEWLKGRGEEAFFPELTLTTKGLYDGWARWWAIYVRAHKAIPEGKRQLRELRHNFPTEARRSGVSGEAIGYLLGHKGQGMTARYGELTPLGMEILKISDFGIDLSIVPRWKPQ